MKKLLKGRVKHIDNFNNINYNKDNSIESREPLCLMLALLGGLKN